MPIDITLFDIASRIGGRTTTVDALDDPRYPTELGASIFVEVNQILYKAAQDFNLSTDALKSSHVKGSQYSLGVWDGESFVLRMAATEDGGNSWWDLAKLVWRYGLAPYRTQQLMKSTTGRFFRFYDELFPFSSLNEAAARVGLVDFTASTGKEVLKQGGVSDKYSTEIVQASTRVNYGQNLGGIHGLEALVCMATDGAMAVEGGNWQIFDRMLNASEADVRLNTKVTGVKRLDSGTYTIQTTEPSEKSRLEAQLKQEFDAIVLAAPHQFSDIKFTPSLRHVPDEIPYVKLHVTLFTTPYCLSPSFFNFDSSASGEVPEMVLTTLPEGMDLGARMGKHGVGPAGFWSVNLLRTIDHNGTTQYLYKVFSPERLNATWMSDLLGLEEKAHSNGPPKAQSTASSAKCPKVANSKLVANHEDDNSIDQISKEHITWSYEKVWDSYPYELPRQTFERIKLDKNVWYTSGIESFISTMETSALMGKNVAKLIVDEYMQ